MRRTDSFIRYWLQKLLPNMPATRTVPMDFPFVHPLSNLQDTDAPGPLLSYDNLVPYAGQVTLLAEHISSTKSTCSPTPPNPDAPGPDRSHPQRVASLSSDSSMGQCENFYLIPLNF